MQRIQTIGIRGAGLAGLSVARELLRIDRNLSISVFDQRSRLPHPQRTFCFFGPAHVTLSATIPVHSWPQVLFRGPSFERRVDVSCSPYTMIRGDDFFSDSLEGLEASGVAFHWNCKQVELDENALCVDDERLTFDCVIDAAFNPSTASSMMWQSFSGIQVETTNAIFDSTTAILMDLQASSHDAPVSFIYALPTSPHHALVEHTTFSPTALSPQRHIQICREWLKTRACGGFRIVSQESGTIPMGLRVTNHRASFVVGTNSGTVRPATGYAFQDTLTQAHLLSQAVLRGSRGSRRTHPWWLILGDTLFLRALLHSPETGEELMARLLSRAPAEALIAFLSGRLTPRQALSVWLSVPKVAMIRAVLRR